MPVVRLGIEIGEEVLPVEALHVDPPLVEYLYPVIFAPLVGAVNATLSELSPPVIPVIVGALG